MQEFLKSVVVLLIANAIGLGLASLVIGPGFRLSFGYFFVAVLIFTAIEAAAMPILSRISARWLPQMMGGLSLVAVFAGLLGTQLILPGKAISGLNNWLFAPLLVWIISLAVQIFLPRYLFKAGADAKS
jgi:Mycobacterial 4 TMS phage holin, superfamily IV